jgi:integrase
MPIRKHGTGWEVRLQHAGERTSKSFSSYRDAQEYERRLRQRVEDHRVGRAPKYSLEEAIERWLDGEAKSLGSYQNLVNKVRAIYPHVAGKALEEAPDAAEQVKAAGAAAGLRPGTINRRLAILRRVARLAHRRWEWVDRDIAARIALVPGEEPRYVQATESQVDALLRHAEPRTRQAIVWAALTGLRQGELRRVEPHHFRDGALAVEKKTKTGRPRMVPLARGLDPDTFPYSLTNREVTWAFREARKAAGMEWLQFRDLRRTCGSWIVQRTKSLKAAQDILGHTTIAITAAHYAHLLDEHLREAVKTLPTFAGMARGRQKKKKAA